MNKLSRKIVDNKFLILVISLLLIIPSIIGYLSTRVNYDILVYLPKDIETLKGENILTDDFHMGSFSIMVVENMADKDLIKLEEDFREIDGVNRVVSINDFTGSTIPIDILPNEIKDKLARNNTKLVLATFENSTSDDLTLAAVQKMRDITDDKVKIGGMSAMVLDTKELFNSQMLLYVVVAVICCILVLILALDSYIVPFLLIANIGLAIIYNMGSNIIFGEICYITKAIAAVLQLGVTTDFSIFLYHKYEKAKKEYKNNNDKAMSVAIEETLTSILGSSLTTIAGFLALCTMKLTLGVDIGLVMAKGVLFGLICVVTVFPSILLMCDKLIVKTKHKEILPKFKNLINFTIKYNKIIFITFCLLLIPAYLAQSKAPIYYKLDSSIPDDYGYSIASKELKKNYNMISQEIVIYDKNIKDYQINNMIREINDLDGIDSVLSPTLLSESGITDDMIPKNIRSIYETDKYKMLLINSKYDIATNELNSQIDKINNIVNKYDKKAIVAGEGPLMKDLVNITSIDLKNVNYTSIIIIFILMIITLKSISLPVLLVTTIEFAIFLNMGVPYFADSPIPFIASIVIGTIQLGATIDYAILMTTKYLEERKKGQDKVLAVKTAMENSVNSVIVSGMCFFGATFGVGIVSTIDMIGSLCKLIARGAVISMVIVILVLPSVLLIFDGLITKTTLGFKKGMK